MIRRRKRNHFSRRDDVVKNDRFETSVTNNRKQQNVFSNNTNFESVKFFKINVELKQFLISIKNKIRFKIFTNREQFSISTENEIWICAKTRQKQFLTKIKNEIKSWIDHKRKFNENVIFFFVEISLTLKFLFVLFSKKFFFSKIVSQKKNRIVILFSLINDRAKIFESIFFQILQIWNENVSKFFSRLFFSRNSKIFKIQISVDLIFFKNSSFVVVSFDFVFVSFDFVFVSFVFVFVSFVFVISKKYVFIKKRVSKR